MGTRVEHCALEPEHGTFSNCSQPIKFVTIVDGSLRFAHRERMAFATIFTSHIPLRHQFLARSVVGLLQPLGQKSLRNVKTTAAWKMANRKERSSPQIRQDCSLCAEINSA